MTTDHKSFPPVQGTDATPVACLLEIAGPLGAVLIDAEGRVEAIVHRDFPEVSLDQPRPRGAARHRLSGPRAARNTTNRRKGTALDFTEFLTDLDHGRVHQHLGEQLERVIDGVQTHNGEGSVTLTLKVKKEGNRATVAASTKVSIPTEPLAPTIFFFGRDGGLHRDDPQQLKLKELDKPVVKEVPRG